MALKFKCADIGIACEFDATAGKRPIFCSRLVLTREMRNLAAISPDVMTRVEAANKQA